jgi:DNA-binding transcriptional ArsR family regulator
LAGIRCPSLKTAPIDLLDIGDSSRPASSRLDSFIAICLYRQMATIKRDAERLDRAFSALADPTRRAILARLAVSEATVSELAAPFELSQPTISKHLKVLADAGFIESGRDAQRRPRKLVPAALKDVADWVEPFRRQWEARLDNLDRHLKTMSRKEKPHAAKEPNSRRHQGRS